MSKTVWVRVSVSVRGRAPAENLCVSMLSHQPRYLECVIVVPFVSISLCVGVCTARNTAWVVSTCVLDGSPSCHTLSFAAGVRNTPHGVVMYMTRFLCSIFSRGLFVVARRVRRLGWDGGSRRDGRRQRQPRTAWDRHGGISALHRDGSAHGPRARGVFIAEGARMRPLGVCSLR